MATLDRMQIGMREFIVVENLEDVIWRVREFLTFCSLILVVSNPLSTKRESHLVTYESGKNQSQIDYILVTRKNIKLVCDMKVIPNEECVTSHKLPVFDAKIVKSEDRSKTFVPKRRGSSNKLIFVISFLKFLEGKLMTPQVSK